MEHGKAGTTAQASGGGCDGRYFRASCSAISRDRDTGRFADPLFRGRTGARSLGHGNRRQNYNLPMRRAIHL